MNLGYSSYFRNQVLEGTFIDLFSNNQCGCELPYFIGLSDEVSDGWAAGVSLTVNSWNWVSNEFTYMRQQTKFVLVGYDSNGAVSGGCQGWNYGLVNVQMYN